MKWGETIKHFFETKINYTYLIIFVILIVSMLITGTRIKILAVMVFVCAVITLIVTLSRLAEKLLKQKEWIEKYSNKEKFEYHKSQGEVSKRELQFVTSKIRVLFKIEKDQEIEFFERSDEVPSTRILLANKELWNAPIVVSSVKGELSLPEFKIYGKSKQSRPNVKITKDKDFSDKFNIQCNTKQNKTIIKKILNDDFRKYLLTIDNNFTLQVYSDQILFVLNNETINEESIGNIRVMFDTITSFMIDN